MYNLTASYKYYKEKNPQGVNSTTYLKIVSDFMLYIMSKVFEGFEVKLPRIGTISIVGRKVKPKLDEEGNIKGLAPNWAKTKQLWDSNPEAKAKKELVYCFNEHSNGIKYNFKWGKGNVLIVNKMLYSLRLSRDNKRTLNRLITEENREYIVLQNFT